MNTAFRSGGFKTSRINPEHSALLSKGQAFSFPDEKQLAFGKRARWAKNTEEVFHAEKSCEQKHCKEINFSKTRNKNSKKEGRQEEIAREKSREKETIPGKGRCQKESSRK
ncbi:MAG: hypothetical protein M0R70_08215 [Nitrospirae bacterium]|nr:hypothetical protein [Nitrospirota bacterium]